MYLLYMYLENVILERELCLTVNFSDIMASTDVKGACQEEDTSLIDIPDTILFLDASLILAARQTS